MTWSVVSACPPPEGPSTSDRWMPGGGADMEGPDRVSPSVPGRARLGQLFAAAFDPFTSIAPHPAG